MKKRQMEEICRRNGVILPRFNERGMYAVAEMDGGWELCFLPHGKGRHYANLVEFAFVRKL